MGDLGSWYCGSRWAFVFFAHGWQKIRDMKRAAAGFDVMGFKPGSFWVILVTLLEFFGGGIGFLFGFLTQPIAILLAVQFAVIVIWRIGTRQPFIGGWELDLVILYRIARACHKRRRRVFA